MRRLLLLVVYILAMLGMAGWMVYRIFSNLDVTPQRLLVAYWYEWLAIFIIALALETIRLRARR